MATGEHKFEIEKFNGKKFELWRLKFEDLSVQKDQWTTISGRSSGMSNEDWQKLDRKDMGTLRLCLDSVLLNVSDQTTTKGLWDQLQTLYQTKNLTNELFLRKQLYSLKMRE